MHHCSCIAGHTGWQGKIGDLDLYKKLRSEGEPSPLLRIAESWLRAELVEKKQKNEREEASGPQRLQEKVAGFGAGGFDPATYQAPPSAYHQPMPTGSYPCTPFSHGVTVRCSIMPFSSQYPFLRILSIHPLTY